ncbi:ComEA family DNA-binding protein [Leifsonia sp. NPDC077715]|uniref:ComEA family DNA-binding protein n=1 Tax=Leifsonia sp. NPDC077715 TaxID=3155539 RepID=UPI0034200F39
MRHRAESVTDADAPERRSASVRVGVGAAVVLVILVAVVGVLVSAAAQGGSEVPVEARPSELASSLPASTESAGGATLLVHVTGAVRKPGIASLPAGSRVLDAVAAAGGLTEDADPAAVNLARPLVDGEQLVVLRVGEAPAPAAAPGGTVAAGGTVNLNTATQADLETLPRIGPALAQRILDWRQANGRFAAVTDLLKVSGIGQKLFDGLKDRVAV